MSPPGGAYVAGKALGGCLRIAGIAVLFVLVLAMLWALLLVAVHIGNPTPGF